MRPADPPKSDLNIERQIRLDPPIIRRGLLLFALALPALIIWWRPAISAPEAITALFGSFGIAVLVWHRGLDDDRSLVLMALSTDVVGVLSGVTAPAGLAFAILMPCVGVAAMSRISNNRIWATLAVCAVVATAAGIVLAMTIGPRASALNLPSPVGTFLVVMALTGLGLLLLWRSSRLQARAVEAAVEAAARSAASADELTRTTAFLRTLLDASPLPVLAIATDKTVLAWNAASERLFGWSAEETIGRPLPEAMTPPDELELVMDQIRRAFAGEIIRGERIRRRTKDGREVLIEIHAAAMYDGAGKPVGIVGAMLDVSERQALEDERRAAAARELELEDRLRQAAKMEAVGQLAGGVAHDFNNMLTAIRGFAELAEDSLSAEESSAREDMAHIIDTSDTAARLTQQLLTFARRNVLEPKVVDPAEVVRATVPMIGRLVGEHIEVTIEPGQGAGLIRVDPAHLEQAIVNLAVNARDAMIDGGRLSIGVDTIDLGGDFVAQHPGAAVGPYVVIKVSDTGVGIDETTREHIFEPFFTTKDLGKGTGMGLATVFGIVSMSGGVIDVTSDPGAGTCFALYFPKVVDGALPAQSQAVAGTQVGGSETILLVEDDASVRRFARRSLEALGYTVLEACDGLQALAVVAAHVGPLDLLVSDIAMPHMQGTELARRLGETRPDLGILLISGYAEAATRTEAPGNRGFLAKPYSQAALAHAVREALATR